GGPSGRLLDATRPGPVREPGEGRGRASGPPLGLVEAAIRFSRELERALDADLEVNVSGGLIGGADDPQLRVLERKAAIERGFGVETELLDRDGLRRLAPYVSEHMVGGLFCPLEGRANPLLAAPVLARAASAHGARLRPRTDVHALERTPGGGLRLSPRPRPAQCDRRV